MNPLHPSDRILASQASYFRLRALHQRAGQSIGGRGHAPPRRIPPRRVHVQAYDGRMHALFLALNPSDSVQCPPVTSTGAFFQRRQSDRPRDKRRGVLGPFQLPRSSARAFCGTTIHNPGQLSTAKIVLALRALRRRALPRAMRALGFMRNRARTTAPRPWAAPTAVVERAA